MKVLIYGAGAIGSTFGGFLSPNHDVTLLGRPKHLNAIRKKGLHISGIWGKHHFKKFHLESDSKKLLSQKIPFDLILLTVKSYDTEKAAQDIRKLITSNTVVISLQNGLGNIEALHKKLAARQVLGGRVIFGAALPKPGQIKITVMAEPTAIGETSEKRLTPRVKEIARLFSKAGVPSVPTADIESVLWRKVIYNCALNPLASLLSCHYGKLTEEIESRLVMAEVVCEIYDVAKKSAVKLDPATPKDYLRLFYSKLVARTYDHRPSMLQDLEKGKRTEIDALNAAIVKLGKKYGVKTPINAKLAELIKRKETDYKKRK
jgi:2-dehydropantoate 2-reductase